MIRSSKLCHTDRRNDSQNSNYPTGPNELTRLNLSAAPNGAFSRPVKRHREDREKVRFDKRERKPPGDRGGQLFNPQNTDVEIARNAGGKGMSGAEKRGITKGGDTRCGPDNKKGEAYRDRSDNGISVAQKQVEIGSADLKSSAKDSSTNPDNYNNNNNNNNNNNTNSNNNNNRTVAHPNKGAVKASETDPIRSHLLDTNRFYRSHLWREVPAKTGPFRPVTPRHRHRDTDHTSWQHHDPASRHIDNNRTDRAFRPVAPRRHRFHDPTSYSQSPTRCSSLITSPESILQTQIKALQSQSLHENVTNKEQPAGDILRGIGTFLVLRYLCVYVRFYFF